MAQRVNNNNVHELIELISEQGFGGMVEAAVMLMNEAMRLERSRHLQAAPYERSEERQGHANEYKPKTPKTPTRKIRVIRSSSSRQ